MGIQIQPVRDLDREWVRAFIIEHWSSPLVVAHGQVFRPHELPGFLARNDLESVGLVTYRLQGKACEIVTLNSVRENQGVGCMLISAVESLARRERLKRLWLITTNDNLRAIGFYQKRGFHLKAVYPDALELSRRIKPQIPLTGEHGIPLRDELEFEKRLG